MRKCLLYLSIIFMLLIDQAVKAQDFDTKPLVNINNEKENLNFTVGARFMADEAVYHTDYTKMKSGASITDSRIRTSLTYKDWYFYADFGFAGGKFTQKNIFMQYNIPTDGNSRHIIKAGYYNDPADMARNTSLGSYHFISRPAPSNALAPGRELGISYKFYNKTWFANQGVFTENMYNDQSQGSQNIEFGGRWLFRPINNNESTFHAGISLRYGKITSGEEYRKGLGIIKTQVELGTPNETYVDPKEFVGCTLPWANQTLDLGGEFLYRNQRFFARGEYMFKRVWKKRDSYKIYIDDLGTNPLFNWVTYSAWSKAYPLRPNNFDGGYLEVGYSIFGSKYKYDDTEGLISGLNSNSLEVVARYSYTNLNDIIKGELYVPGRNQYYPNGQISDYPYESTSIGGGKMKAITIGINYSFNQFVQAMLDYTYTRLNKDYYVYDKNFHILQARLIFSF